MFLESGPLRVRGIMKFSLEWGMFLESGPLRVAGIVGFP